MKQLPSRLTFVGRDKLVYEEDGRTIEATIDFGGAKTVVIFAVSIGRWTDDPKTTISDSERQVILQKIKGLLETQGLQMELM